MKIENAFRIQCYFRMFIVRKVAIKIIPNRMKIKSTTLNEDNDSISFDEQFPMIDETDFLFDDSLLSQTIKPLDFKSNYNNHIIHASNSQNISHIQTPQNDTESNNDSENEAINHNSQINDSQTQNIQNKSDSNDSESESVNGSSENEEDEEEEETENKQKKQKYNKKNENNKNVGNSNIKDKPTETENPWNFTSNKTQQAWLKRKKKFQRPKKHKSTAETRIKKFRKTVKQTF